jgi:hypothetical protein
MRTATRFLCSSDFRRGQGTIEGLCQGKALMAAKKRCNFMDMAAGTQIEPANQLTVVIMLDIDMNEPARKADALNEPIFGKAAELQIGGGDEKNFMAPGSPITPAESQIDQGDVRAHEADDWPGPEIPEEETNREVQCRNNAEKNRKTKGTQ